jgi:hypothetical protein
MTRGASSGEDRAVVNGAGQAVSALRDGIPSAVRGFRVGGHFVSTARVADAVMRLANRPAQFKAIELASALVPLDMWAGQEATNRLMQRWRKMGLTVFERGLWRLTRGSWQKLQAQAIEARRAEATGSVHESAVGNADASDAALLADICDNMAEVLKPLPGELPNALGAAGTRATESGEGDEA